MLKRKIEKYLVNWGKKDRKKCLIVEGPRQVGKTYIINDYAVNNYDENNYIYVDFLGDPSMIRIFNRDIEVNRFYNELKIRYPHKNFDPGETLIFFDNIHLCTNVIPYLRKFTEDGSFDVIASGSPLGVIYNMIKTFPIGYVDRYNLGGLDFEEYLWANGFDEERIGYIHESFKNEEFRLSASHDILIDLFREYMAIGGMPKVVSEYLKQRNFKLAYDIQREILTMYLHQIEDITTQTMFQKVSNCLESIPRQLEKENKKFQFRLVSNKGRKTMYESSVKWLLDSSIVLKSTNLEVPKTPLSSNVREGTFKLYMHDPGLLVSMYGEATQLRILRGEILVHNGAVLENVIACMLERNGFNLYYYEKNSNVDVDFVVAINQLVHPIIVKEADNSKSKVLKSLNDKFGVENGIKLSHNDINKKGLIETFPLYMGMFITR